MSHMPQYIAICLQGLDSVTECITEGEKIKVYQSYNLDYYRNLRLLTVRINSALVSKSLSVFQNVANLSKKES